MAKALMVQGTASCAGKSLTVTGLCRILRQDGYKVAPFKSQNMALNTFFTADGQEIARAQVAQAEAAGIEPSVLMNPILLKPMGDATSQVVLNGEVYGVMPAAEYYRKKLELVPLIERAYRTLAERYDIIVIEGAGSPTEINLMENDIVNMGVARLTGAPVILVGDIDRGGVFASLYGTLGLLPPDDRARVRGLVLNKFRGDLAILKPGLDQLTELTGVPVLGVIPMIRVDIDEEDSLTDRVLSQAGDRKILDCAVVRLPHMSNFTDFTEMDRHPAIAVRYVDNASRLGRPDICIIPGSKVVMKDLLWFRNNGFAAQLRNLAATGTVIAGICGGFQMLGESIADPLGVEGGGVVPAVGLLPMRTQFEPGKVRLRVTGKVSELTGYFSFLSGSSFEGYEIHMGRSELFEGAEGVESFTRVTGASGENQDGLTSGRVMGTYVHGFFDSTEVIRRLAGQLLAERGYAPDGNAHLNSVAYKDSQYDVLADAMRRALDMKRIYEIIGI